VATTIEDVFYYNVQYSSKPGQSRRQGNSHSPCNHTHWKFRKRRNC